MDYVLLAAIVSLAGIGLWLFITRRERQGALSQQTVRCPLADCSARVLFRTTPLARAGRRYRDVVACSLVPAAPLPAHPAPSMLDVAGADAAARGALERAPVAARFACDKHCLFELNAADAGWRAASIADGNAFELARRTQPPGVMRALIYFGM